MDILQLLTACPFLSQHSTCQDENDTAEEIIDPGLVQSFRTSQNMEQHLLSGHLGREDLGASNVLGNRKVVLPTRQTLMKMIPR